MNVCRSLLILFSLKSLSIRFPVNNILSKVYPHSGWTLLFFILTLVSCNKIDPVPSVESYQEVQKARKISEIRIPVELRVVDLERIINKNLVGLLYEDNNFEDDNLQVKVWKQSDIVITTRGDEFFYEVPLKVLVRGRYKVEQFGFNLSQEQDAEFSLKLKFKTKINVQHDWKIQTRTTAMGHEWITDPVLKVGFVTIPLKFFADNMISSQQNSISEMLDAEIANSLEIKSYASEIWTSLQEPMLMQDQPQIWMTLHPSEVFMTEPKGDSEVIETILMVRAYPDIKFGAKPKTPLVPLPPLKVANIKEEDFFLSFDSDISYESLTNLAKEYMIGHTFEFRNGRKQVKIDDLKIFGSNDKLIFELVVSGSVRGKLYLSSTPYYDSISQTLGLKQVDFDFDTKNQLLKTASWLAYGTLQKKIEENLKYPVAGEMAIVKELVSKEFADKKISDNVYLQADIEEIAPQEIYLTRQSLKMIVDSKGRLKLSVRN